MAAFLLKFRGAPEPQDAYHLPAGLPLEAGKAYEVAEIYELEGFLMVREPGATRWPRPGSHHFGWHPHYFELSAVPIPIVSCGFEANKVLTNFFGVLFTRPEHVACVRALKAIALPDDEEELDAWADRAAGDLPPERAEALFELLQLPALLQAGEFSQVFQADQPLGSRFAYLGWFLADLARAEVSRAQADDCLSRLIDVFDLSGVEVGELDVSFWQGTDGGDRLINAPPDGRLIYGTLNAPADQDPETE